MKALARRSVAAPTRSRSDSSSSTSSSGPACESCASEQSPDATWLAGVQTIADASRPAQAKKSHNKSNLPGQLEAGVENLSGVSMDDVRVHYNSDRPARLDSYAYTQGSDIYIGPGQESHVAHEAWHVVQQKQGRVKPTLYAHGAAINDSPALEREATLMGDRASGASTGPISSQGRSSEGNANKSMSRVVQRAKFPTYTNPAINGTFNARTMFSTHNDGYISAESPEFDITGQVTITPGTESKSNSGVQIGFVQTLLASTATGKYGTLNGKQERFQIGISPQPVRDGDKGITPWYEKDDVADWGGAASTESTQLYDQPTRGFDLTGKDDGQPIYGTAGEMTFKTWLIAWHGKKAKYLKWVTWTVDFNSTKAGNSWTSDNNSRITDAGDGPGRSPGAAKLGDPVANDAFVFRWRKVKP